MWEGGFLHLLQGSNFPHHAPRVIAHLLSFPSDLKEKFSFSLFYPFLHSPTIVPSSPPLHPTVTSCHFSAMDSKRGARKRSSDAPPASERPSKKLAGWSTHTSTPASAETTLVVHEGTSSPSQAMVMHPSILPPLILRTTTQLRARVLAYGVPPERPLLPATMACPGEDLPEIWQGETIIFSSFELVGLVPPFPGSS